MQIGYIINEGKTVPSEATIVSENNGFLIAEGIFQEAEEENRNGRLYRREDLLREISCPRTKELLKAGYMRGESGHPMSSELKRQQTIDPSNTCYKVLEFHMDGNYVKGTFRGTNNELGRNFDADLRDGDLPAFSLRALGGIENKNGKAIVTNLKMICYDHVIYPSHSRAYTERVLGENAFSSNSVEVSVNSTDHGILIPIITPNVLNYIMSESANMKFMMDNFDIVYENASYADGMIQLRDKDYNIYRIDVGDYVNMELMNYYSKY